MLSVIKTALITIIISFISGVLLDAYKNFAPRILCSMRRVRSDRIKNKASKMYIYTVSNSSNKILHDININVQAPDNSLKVEEAKISSGLKFDLVNENNDYNFSIPFLSKYDEFSLKLLVDNNKEVSNKPIINFRSPEAFKIVNCKNRKIDKNKRDNNRGTSLEISSLLTRFFHNRKLIIAIASVLIIIYGVILGVEYFNSNSGNITNTSVESTTTDTTLNDKKDNNTKANEKVIQNSNNNNSNQKKASENKKETNTDIKSNDSKVAEDVEKENSNTKSSTNTSSEGEKVNEDKKAEDNKQVDNPKENIKDDSIKSQEGESKEKNKASNTDNSENSQTTTLPPEDKNVNN